MIQQNKIYQVALDGQTVTKLEGNTYVAFSNNVQVDYVYAPFLTTDVVYVRYVPQKYFAATNVVPIPLGYMSVITDQTTIDEVMANQTQISGYNLFKRAVNSDVTGINDTPSNMGIRVSFVQTQLQTSTDYLDYVVYTSLTQAGINAQLKLDYATAVTGNFVNVLDMPADVYYSWEFDGTDWINQSLSLIHI